MTRRGGLWRRPRSGALRGLGLGLCLLLLPIPCRAGTGYDPNYDYPNQGDDWYGAGLPDSRYDYPPFALDAFLDGDDYDAGYDPSLSKMGLGPPLLRTARQRYEYRFRFSATSACVAAADCSDGSFCNGSETCADDACQPGTPIVCDDGVPCTADSCSNALGQCVFNPVPPGAVGGLRLTLSHPALHIATLNWDPVVSADAYNVYRGEQPVLGDLGCLLSNVPGTFADDDGALPAGGLFVHLISSRNQCGESGLGQSSSGAGRPNNNPCP